MFLVWYIDSSATVVLKILCAVIQTILSKGFIFKFLLKKSLTMLQWKCVVPFKYYFQKCNSYCWTNVWTSFMIPFVCFLRIVPVWHPFGYINYRRFSLIMWVISLMSSYYFLQVTVFSNNRTTIYIEHLCSRM